MSDRDLAWLIAGIPWGVAIGLLISIFRSL
jgi:hypothetical protein